MKGTLKNKEGKWFVEYDEKQNYKKINVNAIFQLPLHPDDIFADDLEVNNMDGKEVEFEIVNDYEEPKGDIQYAKLITKQGSFDEEGYAITRGFKSPKQEESSNWDEIFDKFLNEAYGKLSLIAYLKDNYNPPVKR